jgi:LAO/AO transport system kinase
VSKVEYGALYTRAKGGDRSSLTQLISALEARAPAVEPVLEVLYAEGGRARVIGVTGAPGSGKSTLIDAITAELRGRGRTVAIVAVDPSSALTGGALLGDRIRMQRHTLDNGVLVRSMSSRGSLGGLARATTDVVALLDAAGWEYVFVETVGVGQADVDIMHLADTIAVVSVPGLGDDIQTIKAGLLEIADIHVVNKADRPDARRAATDLLSMLRLGARPAGAWTPPVLMTDSLTPAGVGELVEAFDAHQVWLGSAGDGLARQRDRMAERLRMLTRDRILERLRDQSGAALFDGLVDGVISRTMSPHAAVTQVIAAIRIDPIDSSAGRPSSRRPSSSGHQAIGQAEG